MDSLLPRSPGWERWLWKVSRTPLARPWVVGVSLAAFLGCQGLPGVMLIQGVQAQEKLLHAEEEARNRKAAAIEASRAAQANERSAAQRARIKPSDPTACPAGDCAVTSKALNLTRSPSEKELRMAGGMGGALSPIGSADVAQYTDLYDRELRQAGVEGGLAAEGGNTPIGHVIRQRRDRIARLKKINLTFGQAMQEWNKHNYRHAAEMLKEHVEEYPDSPWAGEAMLHLGCDAKYNGRFTESAEIFTDLLQKTDGAPKSPSYDIHQKAKLRFADLNIGLGKIDDAAAQLRDLIRTDKDWRRRTWAFHWLRMTGAYRTNARTLRACGTRALGFVLASTGNAAAGRRLEVMQPKRENGFSLAELETLARKNGLPMGGFRGRAEDLATLPMPVVIHYDFERVGGRVPADMNSAKSAVNWEVPQQPQHHTTTTPTADPPGLYRVEHRAGHFLVVKSVDAQQRQVLLFDPQERRQYHLSYSQLDREWSGAGLVRLTKEINKARVSAIPSGSKAPRATRLAWLSPEEMNRTIGGCCGVARPPGDLGADGPKDPDCGAPTWNINPVTLNMFVSDTPLWYRTPIGPAVSIQMSYNSQDATSQNPAFGNKWVFNYGSYLVEDTAVGGGQVTIFQPNGKQDNYLPLGNGTYSNPLGEFEKLVKVSTSKFVLTDNVGQQYVYELPTPSSLQHYMTQIMDPWGNAVTFTYNSDVELTTITDATGRQTNLTYDEYGHIIKATDPFGRIATFSYDHSGNMVEVVDMEGNAFQYTYDSDVYITQINTAQGAYTFKNELPHREFTDAGLNEIYRVTETDPLNQSVQYEWAANHAVDYTSFTSPEGKVTKYHITLQSDGRGRINKTTLPNGEVQSSELDPSSGMPISVTNSTGARTSLTYTGSGGIASITDPRGFTTRFLYAPNGVDVVGVLDATGKRIAWAEFNDKHQITSITDARNDTATFTYTAWGALDTVTNPDNSKTVYQYDTTLGSVTRGQLLAEKSVSSTGTVVTVQNYGYDTEGRMATSVTGPDSKTVSFEYDDLDNVTKTKYPDGSTSQTDYACCGIASVETARNGKKTYYDYDALKRLTRVQDAQGNTAQYDYDANGNLKSLIDAKGNVTSWTYDDVGRVTTKKFSDGTVERYGYDLVNRVLSRMDAKGQVTKAYSDPSGNTIRIDAPGTAQDVAVSYDSLNRPYQVKDNLGTTTYSYDALNRVTSVDGPWASDTITYNYDSLGRRTWMRVNNTDQVDYTYDALSRLKTVAGVAGGTTFNYVGNTDRLDNFVLPNNTKATFSYDNLNRMTQVLNEKGTGDLISRYTYGYETAGYVGRSVRTYVDSQVGTAAAARVNFNYDDVGQITSEVGTETPTPAINKTYGYDPMGNRKTAQTGSGTGRIDTVSTFNSLNQLTKLVSTPINGSTPASGALKYDAAGNLTQKLAYTGSGSGATISGSTEYGYNSQDRLEVLTQKDASGVPTKQSRFTYDGLGRKRIQQEYDWVAGTSSWTKTSEKRYLYDGVDLIQERDGANTITSVYTRAGRIGGLLSKTKRVTGQADAHYYYHYDGQANVVQMTDATQGVVADYKYDAWGNNRGLTGSQAGSNTFRFSTHEIHPLTGMYDCGFRFYDPGSGRFLNRDPIGEAGGLNFYAYAGNNPLSNVDAYGFSAGSILVAFARGVWDGMLGGGMTFAQAMIEAAAVNFLMGSCAPAIPAITAAIGIIGAAFGIAGLVMQIQDILRSNLCPEEKAYRLGLIVGDALAGLAGGAVGKTFGPKNIGCFVAGTLVLMADGTQKPIEQVNVGDEVQSKDATTGEISKKKVERKSTRYIDTTLLITFSDGNQVETTVDHPFYVESSGWKAARELGVGTSIVTRAGPPVQVTSVLDTGQGRVVYNFEVEGTHSYFVGSGLWVHNGVCPQRLKNLPEKPGIYHVKNKLTRMKYIGKGINIAQRMKSKQHATLRRILDDPNAKDSDIEIEIYEVDLTNVAPGDSSHAMSAAEQGIMNSLNVTPKSNGWANKIPALQPGKYNNYSQLPYTVSSPKSY